VKVLEKLDRRKEIIRIYATTEDEYSVETTEEVVEES